MRVAVLSPVAWRTPPQHYGPWESVVSTLTEGLVQEGIDVTLFATADSVTSGKLVATCKQGYEEDTSQIPKVCEAMHISELFERAEEFDIIHNHFDYLPISYSRLVKTPVVTTIHGFSSEKILPVYRKYNGNNYYVSISMADRSQELDYIANVYHGIDLRLFTYNPQPQGYLLFFGRIHPDKGTREAIEIARRCKKQLLIAGIIHDQEYFRKDVEPFVDGTMVRYLGSAGPQDRDRLLGNALALLHPISFEEPFGLSIVEAMACGTPVIAFKKGSMPELIDHGRSGFLVRTIDEAVTAISEVRAIDRRQCRAVAEERFSARRMIEEYIGVYRLIVDERGREGKRPWGWYDILADDKHYKVKKVTVLPSRRLSLQRHEHRQEHWQIVTGNAVVTLGTESIPLAAGQSIDIPRGAVHRIENPGTGNLVFIEVQQGSYVGEDDIERFEDDYQRT